MSTIQIQVSDKTMARYGTQALVARLERLLAWEDLSVEAKAIKTHLDGTTADWEAISEEARQKAWDSYKYTIKDKLPPEVFD